MSMQIIRFIDDNMRGFGRRLEGGRAGVPFHRGAGPMLRGVERGESPDPVPPTNRTAASAVGCVSVRSIWRASWW